MTNNVIAFSTIEKLRGYLRLTKGDMAALLNVTPVTYNNWSKKGIIKRNLDELHNALRDIIAYMKTRAQTEEDDSLTSKARLAKLREVVPEKTPT